MAQFDFNAQSDKLFNYGNTQFLVLGRNAEEDRDSIIEKITHIRTDDVEGAWGTLGWSDKAPFRPEGKIHFSENGNLKSEGSTGKIVDELKSINPLIGAGSKLVERYINLNDVDLGLTKDEFHLDDLPKLRLSLFLKKDEGALVYYQHSNRKKAGKKHNNDEDALTEFIMPNKTDGRYSTERDRLHYDIPALPPSLLETVDESEHKYKLSDVAAAGSFIIKILTFKRSGKSPVEIIKSMASRINVEEKLKKGIGGALYNLVGKEKYALLKFDPKGNDPDEEWNEKQEKDAKKHKKDKKSAKNKPERRFFGGMFSRAVPADIDPGKKTLLLFHGTFSNTYHSYCDLWWTDNSGSSFLQRLIKEGHYEQILSFDHPTITADAKDNIRVLMKLLGNNYFGSNRVDVITTSRGATVGEWLSACPEARGKLEVRRAMMFSPANGVNYFSAGKYLSKALTVWRHTVSGPFAKVLLSLAQFSADFFLELPGCQQMTPGHERLTSVLTATPNFRGTRFCCVVSDWNKKLDKDKKLWRKVADATLDKGIAMVLGWEHDWVVGCKSQRKSPIASDRDRDVELNSIHGQYLNLSMVLDMHTHKPKDIHQGVIDYFTSI